MRKTAIILIILLASQSTAFAQSLHDYLQMAGENNPELKAYFSDYEAALERVPQVGALPDPELSMGIFLKPMERYMGNQQADIQLMQMFPWFGTLSARKDEASKMALVNYEAFQDAKIRLFYKVKTVWYQLYQINEKIKISEESLDLLQSYERLALVRFQSAAAGNSSATMGIAGNKASGMSEVLRIRMEIRGLENNLAYLMDSRITLQAEFNQLLNRSSGEVIQVPDSLPDTPLSVDRMVMSDSMLQNNPMLKILEAEEETYKAQGKTARFMGRPMLGAGVNYMAFRARTGDGMSMGGRDMVMPMVSVSIPLYRKKYTAMTREAELKEQAVGQRLENLANELETQWSAALRDMDDARRRIALYREQSDLAKQTLELLMTNYSASGQGFDEVLRVQQQLLDYQLERIAAVVDQHTALAMLEMLTATASD